MAPRAISERFFRSSRYSEEWIRASASGGANSLWLAEWLSSGLVLRPGMRLLDLGCGRAASSIFLQREFGVQVWATDLWFDPAENLMRICDAGVESGVFPIRADARALPFAAGFFDAAVSIDSFNYYGTDDFFLNNLARFVKPNGIIAIAGAGLIDEFSDGVPPHLQEWWEPGLWSLHSAGWWRRHWEKTGLVEVEIADHLPDGGEVWLEWLRMISPENEREIRALEADAGRNLGYVRVIARRRPGADLEEPTFSIPAHYEKARLLRE